MQRLACMLFLLLIPAGGCKVLSRWEYSFEYVNREHLVAVTVDRDRVCVRKVD